MPRRKLHKKSLRFVSTKQLVDESEIFLKKNFIDEIYYMLGGKVLKKDITVIVTVLLDELKTLLLNGTDILIKNFGTFRVNIRKESEHHDVSKKERIVFRGNKRIKFSLEKTISYFLKDHADLDRTKNGD